VHHPTIEIQAKHGLTAGAALVEVLDRVRRFSDLQRPDERIVVVVDRASTRFIYTDLAADIDRLRSGRSDSLRADTCRLIESLGANGQSLLQLVQFVPIDVDRARDPEAKVALDLLAQLLELPSQIESAWAALRQDAAEICARRLRRTRQDLVTFLKGVGIKTKPPGPLQRLHSELDFSKELIRREDPETALAVLDQISVHLKVQQIDALVQYRYFQQRAASCLQLGRDRDALTFAQRALDHDANGVHALIVAALAELSTGNLNEAQSFAERAVSVVPTNPSAWVAQAHVAAVAGQPAPIPPPEVADTTEFRMGIAQSALNVADNRPALDLTRSLLSEGSRTTEVLVLRIRALSAQCDADVSLDLDAATEIDRLTTEVLDSGAAIPRITLRQLLLVRAAARRTLGQADDAEVDVRRAHDVDPEDPDVILQTAQTAMATHNLERALQILNRPVVESTPLLRAIRASVLAERGNEKEARLDIEAAVAAAAGAPNPDLVRLAAADAATTLKDVDLAERILRGLSGSALRGAHHSLVRARLAFHKGEMDAARALYRDAATRNPIQGNECLAELGSRLLGSGQPEEAVTVFEEVVSLPARALPAFVRSLILANRLQQAVSIIQEQFKRDPVPDWAIEYAAHVAMLQEDIDTLIAHLKMLVQRGKATVSAEIQLADSLLEVGRVPEAVDLLRSLPDRHPLSPRDDMGRAHLLRQAGCADEALPIAFRAFRAAPQDPEMHRGLVGFVLLSRVPPQTISEVGPDTYVHLQNTENNTTRQFTIYADEPVNPFVGELLLRDAETMGLAGRKVGDVIVANEGGWQEKKWKIERIMPASQRVVQDVMEHYEDRFPGAPFFLTGFKVGETPGIKDFAPIIASLQEQKEHTEKILNLYREHLLPLGFVASCLGRSIPAVMSYLSNAKQGESMILAEWADLEGQQQSRKAILEAGEIILSESSLHTAQYLGILDLLISRYTLVIARSLWQELKHQLAEAEEAVKEGRRMVEGGDIGFRLFQLKAGDPALVADRDRLLVLAKWIESHVRIEPRPLESFSRPVFQDEQMREVIGKPSVDAIALTLHKSRVLYADDLGLRRLIPFASGGRSFSSVSLIGGLADQGVFTVQQRDAHLLSLVKRRYAVIIPSDELLITAIADNPPRSDLEAAFSLLAPPSISATEAGWIAARVIRSMAVSPVQLVSIEYVCHIVLNAMSLSWPRRLCVQSFLRASMDLLAFLPNQLRIVRRVCDQFLRAMTFSAPI
jgi:tetratricopeptide (TPR) repeat protein